MVQKRFFRTIINLIPTTMVIDGHKVSLITMMVHCHTNPTTMVSDGHIVILIMVMVHFHTNPTTMVIDGHIVSLIMVMVHCHNNWTTMTICGRTTSYGHESLPIIVVLHSMTMNHPYCWGKIHHCCWDSMGMNFYSCWYWTNDPKK